MAILEYPQTFPIGLGGTPPVTPPIVPPEVVVPPVPGPTTNQWVSPHKHAVVGARSRRHAVAVTSGQRVRAVPAGAPTRTTPGQR